MKTGIGSLNDSIHLFNLRVNHDINDEKSHLSFMVRKNNEQDIETINKIANSFKQSQGLEINHVPYKKSSRPQYNYSKIGVQHFL